MLVGGKNHSACCSELPRRCLYLRQSILEGFHVEPLAKVGLADKRQICGDCTLKVLNRDAHGKISDVDVAAAVAT